MTQTPSPEHARPVRSYVLRQGRVSAAQQRAYEALLPRYGIAFSGVAIDLAAAFGRVAPTVLEIGFGMGETTAAMAAAQPERNFLGVEVHTPGVGALLKRIDVDRLHNVRIIQHDAIEVLAHMLRPASLVAVHLFFPDPWPKKRHHKRRILNAAFLGQVTRVLVPGGTFHMATDWQPYADAAMDQLSSHPELRNTCSGFAPRPRHRPVTKFEARGAGLGHAVWDLIFTRLP
jgi:tRNA (guanine-N7-)-methyltransferase